MCMEMALVVVKCDIIRLLTHQSMSSIFFSLAALEVELDSVPFVI